VSLGRRILLFFARPPRHVFSAPEARQLYLTRQQIHPRLPLQALSSVLAAGVLGSVPARRAGRHSAWLAATAVAVVALVGCMTARVPAVAPEAGLKGVLQRLATLGLWLARPVVASKAWRRARRRG
jgi:hydrogenase/urease accessory protein HupE